MTTRRQQSTLDSLSHLPFPSSTSKMLDEGATTADLSARIDELDALVLRLSASPTPVSVPSPSPSAVVPARPFSALRSALFSGSENPETFINDLERHYRLNVPFFASIDDSRRVDEARTAMSGAAAVWFDNLARIRPLTTWSAFLDEFRRVYLSARGLDNEFDRLRSLRMTGPIQEFVAEFNARLARCENTPSRSAICDFRRALPPSLSAELDRSRVTRFGVMPPSLGGSPSSRIPLKIDLGPRLGAFSPSASHLGSTNGHFPLSHPIPKLPSPVCYQPLRYLNGIDCPTLSPLPSAVSAPRTMSTTTSPPISDFKKTTIHRVMTSPVLTTPPRVSLNRRSTPFLSRIRNSRTTRSTRLDSQPSHPVLQATLPSSPPITTLPLYLVLTTPSQVSLIRRSTPFLRIRNSRTTRSTRLDSQPSHPVLQATLPSSPPMTTLSLHLGFIS